MKKVKKEQKRRGVLRSTCISRFKEDIFIGSIFPFTAFMIFFCNLASKGECLYSILLLCLSPTTWLLFRAFILYPIFMAAEDTGMWHIAADDILQFDPESYLEAVMYDRDYSIIRTSYQNNDVLFTFKGNRRTFLLHVPDLRKTESEIRARHTA